MPSGTSISSEWADGGFDRRGRPDGRTIRQAPPTDACLHFESCLSCHCSAAVVTVANGERWHSDILPYNWNTFRKQREGGTGDIPLFERDLREMDPSQFGPGKEGEGTSNCGRVSSSFLERSSTMGIQQDGNSATCHTFVEKQCCVSLYSYSQSHLDPPGAARTARISPYIRCGGESEMRPKMNGVISNT